MYNAVTMAANVEKAEGLAYSSYMYLLQLGATSLRLGVSVCHDPVPSATVRICACDADIHDQWEGRKLIGYIYYVVPDVAPCLEVLDGRRTIHIAMPRSAERH